MATIQVQTATGWVTVATLAEARAMVGLASKPVAKPVSATRGERGDCRRCLGTGKYRTFGACFNCAGTGMYGGNRGMSVAAQRIAAGDVDCGHADCTSSVCNETRAKAALSEALEAKLARITALGDGYWKLTRAARK